jgi:hypothetical protein
MTNTAKHKIHPFSNNMQDLRPHANCHVFYQKQVKHKHHEYDELWYKRNIDELLNNHPGLEKTMKL